MCYPLFLNLKRLGIFCVLLALSFANLQAAVGDLPPTGTALPDANQGSNDSLRAYLQLQEQLHDTQIAIERSRQEMQAAAVRDSVALSNRLQAIELSLAVERAGDMAQTQRTNYILLWVIGIFGAVGFAAALFTVYFQSRAVSRLADISTTLSTRRGFAYPASAGEIGLGAHDTLSTGSVDQSNSRLVNLVQHLEKRIAELEQTATLPLKQPAPEIHEEAQSHPELALSPSPEDRSAPIAKLLEQGQSLLSSDRAEEAIAFFDEVLAMEPNHAEALVKKGTALEKLRQPQEALEYYDRAIAADNSLTIAYLHKGGLCSRLEKYGEAMECYERALHTQEKKRAA